MGVLNGFLVRVLLWLPVWFAAWYFFSILFTAPLASSVDALMTWLFPTLIEGISQDGNGLTVVTRLVVVAEAGGKTATGDIVFGLNPLKYGYCMPLYTALVLAAPDDGGPRALRWILGVLILAVVQVFGISTEILKVVAFDVGDQGREALGFTAWGLDGLALAYQLGFLILPPVAPIAIWFGQFHESFSVLIGEAKHQDS